MGSQNATRVGHYAIVLIVHGSAPYELCRAMTLDAAVAILRALLQEDNDGPSEIVVRKVPATGI